MRVAKCFSLLVLAICFGFLSQASGPGLTCIKKSTEGSIQGVILDAVTRKPLTGVTVSFPGNKTLADFVIQSDASGNFKFSKLPAGDVILLFEKKGYKIFKSEVQSVKDVAIRLNIEVSPVDEDDMDAWHPLGRFMDF